MWQVGVSQTSYQRSWKKHQILFSMEFLLFNEITQTTFELFEILFLLMSVIIPFWIFTNFINSHTISKLRKTWHWIPSYNNFIFLELHICSRNQLFKWSIELLAKVRHKNVNTFSIRDYINYLCKSKCVSMCRNDKDLLAYCFRILLVYQLCNILYL